MNVVGIQRSAQNLAAKHKPSHEESLPTLDEGLFLWGKIW